jgi:hypothetical protein
MVQKDASFRGLMELLEDFLFTSFHSYLLSEARADRVQQFKAAREEQRLKKFVGFIEVDLRAFSSLNL